MISPEQKLVKKIIIIIKNKKCHPVWVLSGEDGLATPPITVVERLRVG